MPPRSSWKGFLKLSLVSVPVKAYPLGAGAAQVRLNQLHADCNQRVRYKKACPEHGELQGDEIVSGYEFDRGRYVVIDPEELARLRPEGDRAVRIEGFVPAGSYDPRAFNGRAHYLLPDGPVGQKPYQLLREGMRRRGVEAVCEVVFSGKEQLVLLRECEGLLTLVGLHHAGATRAAAAFSDELVPAELPEEELRLTDTLIDASRLPSPDLDRFEDGYQKRLAELIELRIKGEEVVQVPDLDEAPVLDLLAALEASVQRARLGLEEPLEPVAETAAEREKAARKVGRKKTSKKASKKAAKKKTARKISESADGPAKMAGNAPARGARKKAARKRKSG